MADQAVATLGSVTGTVLVNHGAGFVRAAADAPLVAGDRLMAGPGSLATATYADGCAVKVKVGSTVTIGSASPCAGMTAQAGYGQPPALVPAGFAGIPTAGIVLGGLVVGGIIAGVVIASNGNNNNNNGAGVTPGAASASP